MTNGSRIRVLAIHRLHTSSSTEETNKTVHKSCSTSF